MERLRLIPSIDSLQADESFNELLQKETVSRELLTKWLKNIVETMRQQILQNQLTELFASEEEIVNYIMIELTRRYEQFVERNELQPVINATGVVIHTNLGRSRLSERAIEHVAKTARGYATLEYDIELGTRGSRHSIVEEYLKQITGAEAAIVVNNNAAAVYLVLKALAEDKEVIVSRGELVEIGGSFRISEIMRLSDAKLVEIGTTNKTKLSDYANAITEETGLILKVYKSNFAIIGFTEEVDTEKLVHLSSENNIPLYEDLGSGTLFDFKAKKIGSEPTVQEQVKKGIDLISFSGDKLLGGPQAGIIVGKKQYIERLKKHQLARVLRVDKFTLAGLEATLKTYLVNKEAAEIPTVRDILLTENEVYERAQVFIHEVETHVGGFSLTLKEGVSKVGGGTMPVVDLPTYIVEVAHNLLSSNDLAEKLRDWRIPIIVRVKNEAVQLDFRTVTDEELQTVIEAFVELGKNL